jgi:hypothetical protein
MSVIFITDFGFLRQDHYVAWVGLKLMIPLPQSSEYWNRCVPAGLAGNDLFF